MEELGELLEMEELGELLEMEEMGEMGFETSEHEALPTGLADLNPSRRFGCCLDQPKRPVDGSYDLKVRVGHGGGEEINPTRCCSSGS